MNKYYRDSHLLFKEISEKIANKKITGDMDAIQNTLLFALGIEKLLKGIMFDLNPIYILENPDFKNSFSIYHKDKVIEANKKSKDVSDVPNEDVIAFHHCVMRAVLISQTAHDHKNTLMRIKYARDIIVHNSFDFLNIEELKIFLFRDFYIILKSFTAELSWTESECFNNLHSELALIASSLGETTEEKIKLKFDSALVTWNKRKGESLNTFNRATRDFLLQDDFYYPVICPCCSNFSVVFTKPVLAYNKFIKQEIQEGLETTKFQCVFCGLETSDYNELDYLKIEPNTEGKSEIIERLAPATNKEQEITSKSKIELQIENMQEVDGDPINLTGDKLQDINKPDEKE